MHNKTKQKNYNPKDTTKCQNQIRILQTNMNRSYAAMTLLTETIRRKNIDIVIITEPHINSVDRNKWFFSEEINAVIRITANHKPTHTGGGPNFVHVTWKDILIIACYCSPNREIEHLATTLYEISRLIKKHNNKKIIIAGDFNAKSVTWGEEKETARGKVMSEFISANDLILLNKIGVPTWQRRQSSSILDLTLYNNKFTRQQLNWKVSEEENLSDHHNIIITIKEPNNIITRDREKKWVINERKLQNAQQIIENSMNTIKTITANKLDNITKDICNKVFGNKRATGTKTMRLYWWNNDIANIRENCNKYRRKLTRQNKKNTTNEDNIGEHYKQTKKELKTAIKRAKNEAWRRLVEELNENTWGNAYQIVCKKTKTFSKSDLTIEKQEKVIRELFPEAPEVNWKKTKYKNRKKIENDFEDLTLNEIIQVAKETRSGKAPGPDGVPAEVVKLMLQQRPELFREFFNRLIKEGAFPHKWNSARLILIEKPKATNDPQEEPKYRPICLINAWAKTYEGIIRNRIVKDLDNGKLADNQYGFRKKRSTTDAIERVNQINKECDIITRGKRRFCILITIDVKNAFNSLRWEKIIEAMNIKKIPEYLIKCTKNYLHRRFIVFNNKNYAMRRGVPQGSKLGPTLWNIAYDDIFELPRKHNTHLIAYADDLAVVITGWTEEELIRDAEETLSVIERWFKKKELEIAFHKTEATITKGRYTIKRLEFSFGNHKIQTQQALRYLGVMIDRNLRYSAHAQYVVEKAERSITALKRIMPKIDGPVQRKRRIIALTAESIILYACTTWKSALKFQKYRDLILGTQRRLNILTTCAYRTVSTVAVSTVAGSIPIDLMIEERVRMRVNGSTRREERNETMRKWQMRWDNEKLKGQWTKALIGDIEAWTGRKHGNVNYYTTQFLTGHGSFGTYLHRIKKLDNDRCSTCDTEDSPEHALFKCQKIKIKKKEVEREVGIILTPQNIVQQMLENESKWNLVESYIVETMKRREREE